MKPIQTTTFTLLAALLLATLCSGCASTKTENGVTIEENRSYNPMNYLPW